MLLAKSDSGNIYVNGKISSRLSDMVQDESVVPLFGYGLALDIDGEEADGNVPIDSIKTEVGQLVTEILIDASHGHHCSIYRLLRLRGVTKSVHVRNEG